MKKISLLMVFLSLLSSAHGQFWKLRRLEWSAGAGTTQLYSDIGGFSRGENLLGLKDFSFRNTRLNVNMSIRYRLASDFTARLSLGYGGYHSSDDRGSNEGRGFEAGTRFFEHALLGEFYFLKNKAENSFLRQKGKQLPFRTIMSMLDCYAFTGFGLTSYNVTPNALLAAKTTETKGLSPVIPIGLGVNFNYSPDFNFGIEFGGRYTFTDYLDAYSSQYSERNDIYYLFNINVIYKIKTGNRSYPSF